ncbi:MAG: polysaccharide biosynthesis/export family protein, partial [Candidatus Acidiferrales bacterium]
MLHIGKKWTVRTITDWIRAELVLIAPVLVLCGAQALYAQQKLETPQQTNEKIQELAAVERTRPHDVPIGTGDLLHIEVFDVPELSRDVRVGDAGDISYPLIPGRITATGLTPFQLEEKMEQLLIENGLVSHPQVSVFVKEQNSQPVSVVGAVVKPMVYQVIRATTLLEILADAGGITDDAGSNVIVTRGATAAAARNAAAVVGAKASGSVSAGASAAAASADDPLGLGAQTITIRLQNLLESGDPTYNIAIYG